GELLDHRLGGVFLGLAEGLEDAGSDQEAHDQRDDGQDDHDLEQGHTALAARGRASHPARIQTEMTNEKLHDTSPFGDHWLRNWPMSMMGMRIENTTKATAPPISTSMSGSSMVVSRPSFMSTSES